MPGKLLSKAPNKDFLREITCQWVLSRSVVSDSLWPRGARQAPLSMGFSRQEYWSGLPCPPPGDIPNPGIEPRSPTLQVDSLPTEPPGKPSISILIVYWSSYSFNCLSQTRRVQKKKAWIELNSLIFWLHCPGGASGKKNPPANAGNVYKRYQFNPWVAKIPCRRAWPPTPVFWPGESHGQRSLAGYSP